MNNTHRIAWVLRIAIAGEFLGHGVFALQGKTQWIGWIQKFTGGDPDTAAKLLVAVGLLDLLVVLSVLVRPVPIVLLWAVLWGFWTAFVRPLVGESFWDFVERSADWGAPLALLMMRGWPRAFRNWFT